MLKNSVDGIVLNVANDDLGDAVTYYHYFGMVDSGFNMFSLHYEIENTTLTIEAFNGSAWRDVMNYLTDGALTEFTTTGMLTAAAPVPYPVLRVKAVTTNATNSLILSLTRIRA